MAYYPVYLNLQGKRCVVVAGGVIGEEKVSRLLKCGAEVVVISRNVTDSVKELEVRGKLVWLRREYQPGDLKGAVIAIATPSGDFKDKQITSEAAERNVPINIVDVTHLCTFITPAVVSRGDVTMAISTGGASPALARKFRELLSNSRIMGYADLAPILSWAREQLKLRGVRVEPDYWQECITDDLVKLVNDGNVDVARDMLMRQLLDGVTNAASSNA